MKVEIIETRTSTVNNKTLTSMAVIIQRRKIWIDGDLEGVTVNGNYAEFNDNDFCVVQRKNDKGNYIKLMPKFTMEISAI